MELIRESFPALKQDQIRKFEKLMEVVPLLNREVNIISRKDIGHLEERHILHSLAIAKLFSFSTSARIVDAGTGGGFPGIPLAILFPETTFILVDSIGKKTRAAGEIADLLSLKNVHIHRGRIEESQLECDFVVSRAVAPLPTLVKWTWHLIAPGGRSSSPNGLIALKGGNLDEELVPFRKEVKVYPVPEYLKGDFYSSKVVIYLKK